VEELKKKTSYYLTKGLIERYETPPKDRQAINPGTDKKITRPMDSSMSTPSGPSRIVNRPNVNMSTPGMDNHTATPLGNKAMLQDTPIRQQPLQPVPVEKVAPRTRKRITISFNYSIRKNLG
jgi:hypothetical protein